MDKYIFGKNAVITAVQQGIPLKKIFISSSIKDYENVFRSIREKNPHSIIETVPKERIEKEAHGIRTGGICALLPEISLHTSVKSLISFLMTRARSPLIVVLDEIQDPHNFGAIIRSVYGAGFDGVVFQKRRQVGVTAVVASTSAGTCFSLPLCEVTNIVRALSELQKSGFWIYGTDSKGSISIYNVVLNTPLAVVIGSEGAGIKRIVRSYCNEIISIPLSGGLESLNASVAAAVVLFEIKRRLTTKGF